MAGLYYLQDPSAMAPAVLLDPQPGERILDLAAAPGGKTTQLAALMHGRGLLVANEIKDKRLGHLAMNVERWGAGNILITNETPERLADTFGPFFDRVLVDAPCSGEGMFRKDMGARRDWSPEMVQGCAVRQRNILHIAAKLVRPGGYLLYSTCTFAPEEDEEIIFDLLENAPGYEVVSLPDFPGFLRGKPEWARRQPRMEFSPDRLVVRGERLYLTPEEMPDLGGLRLVHPGVWLGTFKKGRFEPAHPLALYLKAGAVKNALDFKPGDSRLAAYLRGETLDSPGEPGWVLVCVDGFGLGWGKRVQGVVKNHYPHGWVQFS